MGFSNLKMTMLMALLIAGCQQQPDQTGQAPATKSRVLGATTTPQTQAAQVDSASPYATFCTNASQTSVITSQFNQPTNNQTGLFSEFCTSSNGSIQPTVDFTSNLKQKSYDPTAVGSSVPLQQIGSPQVNNNSTMALTFGLVIKLSNLATRDFFNSSLNIQSNPQTALQYPMIKGLLNINIGQVSRNTEKFEVAGWNDSSTTQMNVAGVQQQSTYQERTDYWDLTNNVYMITQYMTAPDKNNPSVLAEQILTAVIPDNNNYIYLLIYLLVNDKGLPNTAQNVVTNLILDSVQNAAQNYMKYSSSSAASTPVATSSPTSNNSNTNSN